MPDAVVFRELLLESARETPRRQPELERAVDEVDHLFGVVHASGVADRGFAGNEGTRLRETLARQLAHLFEDFLGQLFLASLSGAIPSVRSPGVAESPPNSVIRGSGATAAICPEGRSPRPRCGLAMTSGPGCGLAMNTSKSKPVKRALRSHVRFDNARNARGDRRAIAAPPARRYSRPSARPPRPDSSAATSAAVPGLSGRKGQMGGLVRRGGSRGVGPGAGAPRRMTSSTTSATRQKFAGWAEIPASQ